MGLFDTTADEEVTKHVSEITDGIDDLIDWAKEFKEVLQNHPKGRAVNAHWATELMNKALRIHYRTGAVYGACLVRGKKPNPDK